MITKEQLAELASLARAATPGPWIKRGVSLVEAKTGELSRASIAEVFHAAEDGDFISAANPVTVLALLDRIAELEQDAARYRWLRDHWHGFDHYRKARGTIADLTREIDEQIQKQQVTTATTIDKLRCTCPSGDGSLRWPCPRHPPSIPQ